jgi:hypothetical protein
LHEGWAVGPHGTIARFVNHLQYNIRYHRDAKRPDLKTGF